jgi:carbon storage regulator
MQMLVLTREAEQDILIGDDIVIKVLTVNPKSGAVRLGIEAPRDIAVDRREVRESKNKVKQQ